MFAESFKSDHTSTNTFWAPKDQQYSILVIDDSEDMLSLQKIILEIEGYLVYTAQNGDEGFKILSEVEKPALIILDMQLDDMTGNDFLDELEKRLPEIAKTVPIVFLSGMEEVPTDRVVGFIRKPFERKSYLRDIRRFCGSKADIGL